MIEKQWITDLIHITVAGLLAGLLPAKVRPGIDMLW